MTRSRRAVVLIAAVLLGCSCAVAVAVAGGGRPTSVIGHTSRAKCHRVRSARHHRVVCRSVHHHSKKVPVSTSPAAPAGRPAAPSGGAVSGPPPGTTVQTTATYPTTTTTTTPAPAPALPSRVAIDEYEYAIAVGHPVVAAGSVQLSVSDIGQDDHDLVISQHGVAIAQTPVLHPGAPATTITVRLAPGTYTLHCALYNHAQMGMTATLVVQ